jgi:hypothetical protein
MKLDAFGGTMRYRYYDLGQQREYSRVVARLRGSAANVILLDPLNFYRYRSGRPFLYTGGHYRRSPVGLQIPQDGHWYLVIDHGGYKGRIRAEIEVLTADESPTTESVTEVSAG